MTCDICGCRRSQRSRARAHTDRTTGGSHRGQPVSHVSRSCQTHSVRRYLNSHPKVHLQQTRTELEMCPVRYVRAPLAGSTHVMGLRLSRRSKIRHFRVCAGGSEPVVSGRRTAALSRVVPLPFSVLKSARHEMAHTKALNMARSACETERAWISR